MEHPGRAMSEDDFHSSLVDRTLKELQRMVREHENALNLVCLKPVNRRMSNLLLTIDI